MYKNKTTREEETAAKGGRSTKENWFRGKGREGQQQFTSTLVVPATCEEELVDTVRKTVEKYESPPGTKVKVVEQTGSTVENQICPTTNLPQRKVPTSRRRT